MKKINRMFVTIIAIFIVTSVSSISLGYTHNNVSDESFEDDIDTHFGITSPRKGNLYVFGTNISIQFLEVIGWSVVIDTELCIETQGAEKADYMEFIIRTQSGSAVSPVMYNKTVYEPPFEWCFENVSTRLGYNITAIAHFNESIIVEDSVYPVAYIRQIDVFG